jgi:hypothetical protein
MALNILGLDLVVLGGRLAQCSPVVLEATSRSVALRVLPIIPIRRTVVRSALGSDAAALGVVLQALDRLFVPPVERAAAPAEDQSTAVRAPAELLAAGSPLGIRRVSRGVDHARDNGLVLMADEVARG